LCLRPRDHCDRQALFIYILEGEEREREGREREKKYLRIRPTHPTDEKHDECGHVTKIIKVSEPKSSEAESLNKYKKKPTLLKMAMYAETCSEIQWKPT
jgi:hypothetical protein